MFLASPSAADELCQAKPFARSSSKGKLAHLGSRREPGLPAVPLAGDRPRAPRWRIVRHQHASTSALQGATRLLTLGLPSSLRRGVWKEFLHRGRLIRKICRKRFEVTRGRAPDESQESRVAGAIGRKGPKGFALA